MTQAGEYVTRATQQLVIKQIAGNDHWAHKRHRTVRGDGRAPGWHPAWGASPFPTLVLTSAIQRRPSAPPSVARPLALLFGLVPHLLIQLLHLQAGSRASRRGGRRVRAAAGSAGVSSRLLALLAPPKRLCKPPPQAHSLPCPPQPSVRHGVCTKQQPATAAPTCGSYLRSSWVRRSSKVGVINSLSTLKASPSTWMALGSSKDCGQEL